MEKKIKSLIKDIKIHIESKDYQSAILIFNNVKIDDNIPQDPNSSKYYYQLFVLIGKSFYEEKSFIQAENYYHKAVSIDNSSTLAYKGLYELYSSHNSPKIVDILENLIRISDPTKPKSKWAHYNICLTQKYLEFQNFKQLNSLIDSLRFNTIFMESEKYEFWKIRIAASLYQECYDISDILSKALWKYIKNTPHPTENDPNCIRDILKELKRDLCQIIKEFYDLTENDLDTIYYQNAFEEKRTISGRKEVNYQIWPYIKYFCSQFFIKNKLNIFISISEYIKLIYNHLQNFIIDQKDQNLNNLFQEYVSILEESKSYNIDLSNELYQMIYLLLRRLQMSLYLSQSPNPETTWQKIYHYSLKLLSFSYNLRLPFELLCEYYNDVRLTSSISIHSPIFQHCVMLYPNLNVAWGTLAKIYIQDFPSISIEIFQNLSPILPNISCYCIYSKLLSAQQPSSALKIIKNGLSLLEDDIYKHDSRQYHTRIYLEIISAECYLKFHQIEKSISIFESYLDSSFQKFVLQKLCECYLLIDPINIDKSNFYCQKLLSIDPKDDWAISHKAWLIFLSNEKNHFEQARKLLEESIKIQPNNPFHHYRLSRIYWVIGGIYRSSDYFYKSLLQSLEIDPSFAEAHAFLGNYYHYCNEEVKSQKSYYNAIKYEPSNAIAGPLIVEMLIYNKDIDNALIICKKAIDYDKSTLWAFKLIGKIHLSNQYYNKAVEAFQHAIIIKPNDEECWFDLGKGYLKQGKYLPAMNSFKKVVEFSPIPAYTLQLAQTMNSIGYFSDCITILQPLFLSLDISNSFYVPCSYYLASALYNEANSYILISNWNRAEEYLIKAKETLNLCTQKFTYLCILKLFGNICVSFYRLPPCIHDINISQLTFYINKRLDILQEGENAFSKTIILRPNSCSTWFDTGIINLMSANTAYLSLKTRHIAKSFRLKAIQCFKSAIFLNPSKYQNWNALGIALMDFNARKHCFVKSIIIEKNGEAYCSLGILFLQNKEYDKALECFQSAQLIDSTQKNLWLGQALLFMKKGQLPQSFPFFEKANSLLPSFLGRFGLALSSYYFNDLVTSFFLLIQCIKESPSNILVMHSLALIYEAIALSKPMISSHMNLYIEKAEKILNNVESEIQLYNNDKYHLCLVNLNRARIKCLNIHTFQSGIQLYQMIFKESGDVFKPLDYIPYAYYLFKNSQIQESIKVLQKAILQVDNTHKINIHIILAILYFHNGLVDKALQLLLEDTQYPKKKLLQRVVACSILVSQTPSFDEISKINTTLTNDIDIYNSSFSDICIYSLSIANLYALQEKYKNAITVISQFIHLYPDLKHFQFYLADFILTYYPQCAFLVLKFFHFLSFNDLSQYSLTKTESEFEHSIFLSTKASLLCGIHDSLKKCQTLLIFNPSNSLYWLMLAKSMYLLCFSSKTNDIAQYNASTAIILYQGYLKMMKSEMCINNQTIPIYISMIDCYLITKRIKEAEKIIFLLQSSNDNTTISPQNRASIFRSSARITLSKSYNNNISQAISLYQEALSIDSNPLIVIELSSLFQNIMDIESSKKVLEQSLQNTLHPIKKCILCLELSKLYYFLKLYRKGKQYIDEALKTHLCSSVLFFYVLFYRKSRKIKQAGENFFQCLYLDEPVPPLLYFNYFISHYQNSVQNEKDIIILNEIEKNIPKSYPNLFLSIKEDPYIKKFISENMH